MPAESAESWMGDNRALTLAKAMRSEYHTTPSAVYVRADGSIHLRADGFAREHESLRALAFDFALYVE